MSDLEDDRIFRKDENFILNKSLLTRNSEENYYSNTIRLNYDLVDNPNEINHSLRGLRMKSNWGNRLKHIKCNVQGSYGQVYIATDSLTNREIVLKNIIPNNEKHFEVILNLWRLMIHSDVLVTGNQTAFIVQLNAIIRDQDQCSFWLFLEYCPYTLQEVLYKMGANRRTFTKIFAFSNEVNVINEINKELSSKFESNFIDQMLIYHFEILCALDYLADRHIVHNQINPNNILLDKHIHVKLSDWNVGLRYLWTDNRVYFKNMNDETYKRNIKIDEFERERENSGNILYSDPETVISQILINDPHSSEYFEEKYQISHNKDYKPLFLNDYYCASLTIAQALLGGFLPTQSSSYFAKDLCSLNLSKEEIKYFPVTISENDALFIKCIYDLLFMDFSSEYKTISLFLIGGLRTKTKRNIKFCKQIKLFNSSEEITEFAIDIRQVEKLEWFYNNGITKENVMHLVLNPLLNQYVNEEADKRCEEAKKSSITINQKEFAKVFFGSNFLYSSY